MASRRPAYNENARFQREFVTSEGVDLRLQLAGAGDRAGAFCLDLLIMVASLIVMSIAIGLLFVGSGGTLDKQLTAIVWLLGFFVLRNGYFIAFELGMRAATPGKRILKLRVVARDGGRLTGEAVVARNVMRELEFYLPISFLFYDSAAGLADAGLWLAGVAWTGVFLFFPYLNRDRLRVGDLIAGTWVVSIPRRKLGGSVVERDLVPQFVFTEAQLGAYGEYELKTLEKVIRQEDEQAVMVVARTIRGRIGWEGPSGGDLEFLQAYYAGLCRRLERNMLFGKRRLDKYQKP